MDYHGTPTNGVGGLQANWAGGGDLEYDCHHCRHPSQGVHIPPRRHAWVPKGGGVGVGTEKLGANLA